MIALLIACDDAKAPRPAGHRPPAAFAALVGAGTAAPPTTTPPATPVAPTPIVARDFAAFHLLPPGGGSYGGGIAGGFDVDADGAVDLALGVDRDAVPEGAVLLLSGLVYTTVTRLPAPLPDETYNWGSGVAMTDEFLAVSGVPGDVVHLLRPPDPALTTTLVHTGGWGAGWPLVAGADVDGDGASEVMVLSDETDGPALEATYRGTARLVGSGVAPGRHDVDDVAWITIVGSPFRACGNAGAIGDLDADGYADVAVGSYSSYVVPSADGGFQGSASVFYAPAAGEIVTEDADATIGGDPDDEEATLIVTGGDLDGDGVDDLVTATTARAWWQVGRVSVWSAPRGELGVGDAVSTLSGGPDAGISDFGTAVASPGDTDGDGADDLVVGGSGQDAVYVIHGPIAGALDADDTTHHRLIGVPSESWEYSKPNSTIGGVVEPLGDIDLDGTADFVIGASGDGLYVMLGPW